MAGTVYTDFGLAFPHGIAYHGSTMPDKTNKPEKGEGPLQAQEIDVLRRMLTTPPQPRKKAQKKAEKEAK